MIYRLFREQTIPRAREDVFQFFADAANLESLTPPWLHFEVMTPGKIPMHPGAVIQYALRIRGFPVHWTTVIPVWNPPFEFVDVQIKGPYLLWHHVHRFDAADGQTRMTDEVHYKLPGGILGRMAHRLWIRRDLETIFDYRAKIISQIFPEH